MLCTALLLALTVQDSTAAQRVDAYLREEMASRHIPGAAVVVRVVFTPAPPGRPSCWPRTMVWR